MDIVMHMQQRGNDDLKRLLKETADLNFMMHEQQRSNDDLGRLLKETADLNFMMQKQLRDTDDIIFMSKNIHRTTEDMLFVMQRTSWYRRAVRQIQNPSIMFRIMRSLEHRGFVGSLKLFIKKVMKRLYKIGKKNKTIKSVLNGVRKPINRIAPQLGSAINRAAAESRTEIDWNTFANETTLNGNSMEWIGEKPMPFSEKPLVSVIVPNFNHSAYLRQRLDSIYNQTYPNFEVILLDDCSTDNSRDILMEYAKKYPDKTVIDFNETNGGKVFKQWNKGIKHAKGKLIWIAESDDWCELDFIEKMVPRFEYESVMLAFCKSAFMQDGKQIWSLEEYLSDIPAFDFTKPFVVSAHMAVRNGFALKNMIPNVSSAMFRNVGLIPSTITEIWENFKLCGDWLFYLSVIRGGCLSYTNETTNYYRVHANSTSLKIQKSPAYYYEQEQISQYVVTNYDVDIGVFQTVLTTLEQHCAALNQTDDLSAVHDNYHLEHIAAAASMRKPNVLMCCFSLQMGGGETYPIYLANEMKKQGACVALLDFDMDGYSQQVRELIDPSIPVIHLKSPDYLGKCVRCHRCESVCPPLNVDLLEANACDPLCLAAMASLEERSGSSSGAVFPILAKRTLAQGGAVVGAAFSEDFRSVDMVVIEQESELLRLRGSKYVQSNAGSVYSEVKKLLKAGRKVLFSGLPCQVAAMRSVMGRQDDDLLLVVDLLCSNAGAPAMYQTYLDEITKGRKITSFNFRSKSAEWKNPTVEIDFEDGSRYHRDAFHGDPYIRGFVSHLYGKQSCTDCPFQEAPRQGDISIGDCWSVEKLYPEWDCTNGVSVVLLNNQKGKQAFDTVREAFECRPVPFSFLPNHNRIHRKVRGHLAQDRFLKELLPTMPFSQAVDMALGWKFDVALTGMWMVRNYGGSLTYFALYHQLLDMGYHPIMVESCDLSKAATPKSECFREQPYPFYNVSRIHNDLRDMEELNNRVKAFVLGSDQVFNPTLFKNKATILPYWLTYVRPWRKRIAYATSFGSTRYLGDETMQAEFGAQLRKFDHVSVREKSGVGICRKTFGVEAVHTVDPVFLCDPAHYDALAEKSKLRFEKPTLAAYMLWPMDHVETKESVKRLAQLLKSEYIVIGDKLDAAVRMEKARSDRPDELMYDYAEDIKSEDWVYAMKNASFILADSFHAVAFSIVFHKQFLFSIGNKSTADSGLERLTSLLEPLGLMNRMVPKHISAVDYLMTHPELRKPIDYDAVYEKLEPMKEASLAWLRHALDTPKG